MTEKTRLNKYLSDSGICSRREADKLIETGHVTVNGHRAKIGEMVSKHDKVMLNGNLIESKKGTDFVFIAFNKPNGIISTTEIGVKDSIIDYIGYHERIFPVGRLDKDSQGLIFLTNNGDIVNKILRAGNKHEKEYLVTVNKPITDDFLLKMSNGVPILGEITKKCKISKESVFVFRITLIQGLNRQIRRMCEYFDFEVTKLERIRIMNISLKGLPLGEWRQLETIEIESIMDAITYSSNENNSKNKKTGSESQESRAKSQESRTKNQELRIKSQEPRIKNQESRIKSQEPRDKRQEIANSNQDGSVYGSKSEMLTNKTTKVLANNKPSKSSVENPKAKELRGKAKNATDKKHVITRSKSTNSNFNKSRKK